ncbi:hypothetical protein O181_018848 [Austropuccinia psidii MF-1]|uniref:GAG-pre-integrase domain-containing protein n=1 Tax=Austropuccinia psidii MF-1 TaxID=1389203 RepID=A0A9Q3C8K7_9BASI|nr:hypothetical protein [Austropuccinia psidii MF-1]
MFVRKIEASKEFFTNGNEKDWNSILGHPSDNYLRHMLDKSQIKANFVSSRDCEVCQETKIKNWSHTHASPSSNSAFYCLHVDTLEIQPATD